MSLLVLAPNKPFLGAQVVQLPFLSELRARHPEERITLAVPFRGPTLFEEFRYHDSLVRGWAETASGTLALLGATAGRFREVYSLRARSTRAGVVALLSGARRRFGFDVRGQRAFFNRPVCPREDVYLALKYLDLLGDEEPWQSLPELGLWSAETEVEVTARFVERGIRGLRVGFLPGAGGEKKRWPPERFLALGRRVRAEFPGAAVLFFLSPDDASGELGRALSAVDRRSVFVFDSIRALACALSTCALLVSSDCGPAHLGHLLGLPQIVLFGGLGRPGEWFLPRPCARYLMAEAGGPVASIEEAEVMNAAREAVGAALP
jgi:ADP-heptose:LPS heptosyltransferase